MNKKVMKIVTVLMVVAMLIIAISPVVNAAINWGDWTYQGSEFDDSITTIGKKVLNIITTIGIVISILVIAGLGIKYITGSAEEKAEYKQSFVPLLVGMVLLLGASGIAKYLVNVASQTGSIT